MQRILIAVGAVLFLVVAMALALRLGLGHLPGDIRIETENGFFYFPIVTCVIISAVLSLVIWFSVARFLYPGKVRKSALTPFHTICTPMQTRMKAVSLNRTFIPASPIMRLNRSA